MDSDILKKLEDQNAKLEAIYRSVEETRAYLKWTLIITIVLFVLPLVGLFFAIPSFMSMYSDISSLGI